MEFKVNSGMWGNMFGVPCVVADNLLKIASGSQIKVLMYILRHSGKDCSYEEISSNTGVALQETKDAVNFWQQANIVSPDKPAENVQLDFFSPTPPEVQNTPEIPPVRTEIQNTPEINNKPELQNKAEIKNTTETVPENPPEQKKKIMPPEPKRRTLTGTEILKYKMQSSDISELINAVQSVLGNVNHMYISKIIYMHDDLGLSNEVIMTLITYCKSINKIYPDYISKVAYEWAKNGITTKEQAEKEVHKRSQNAEYKNQVMKIMQIDRLSENQEKLIECWKEWGISIEMINCAYQITLDNEVRRNIFKYMNSIITRWHNSGITTVEQVHEDSKLHSQQETKPKDKKSGKKNSDFNEDMYDIFVNNFEVIKNEI